MIKPDGLQNRYHPDYLGFDMATIEWRTCIEPIRDVCNRIIAYGYPLSKFETFLQTGEHVEDFDDEQLDLLVEWWDDKT